MSSYRNVNRASRARTLDRGTWAENTVVIKALDIDGAGETPTHQVDFGLVFDGRPMFTYGVELVEGQTLVSGDFPFVSCGVSEWLQPGEEDAFSNDSYHIGALVWINIVSVTAYRLRVRVAFEGIAFKNVRV